MQWLDLPAVKWAIPLPLLAAVAPVVWLFFRSTWRQLDVEALAWRQDLAARGEVDYRPIIGLTLVAFILTAQQFYGRTDFYGQVVRGVLERRAGAQPGHFMDVPLYDELLGQAWWAVTRIGGYLSPIAVWPLLFPRDGIADFGLRTRGFRAHAWIYALCVVVMVPLIALATRQPDFAAYYPMYKLAGRSWFDFVVWETIYVLQFFTLELFFRGFWLRAMRGFGAGAIWSMVVPYCMVHYGKPYFEACGAVVAGVVLGSLAMRTRSIYAGFLVHGTVAVLMDVFALGRRGALPVALAPWSARQFTFPYWSGVIWTAWIAALALVALRALRAWPQLAAAIRKSRGSSGPYPTAE